VFGFCCDLFARRIFVRNFSIFVIHFEIFEFFGSLFISKFRPFSVYSAAVFGFYCAIFVRCTYVRASARINVFGLMTRFLA
jgi:hypothetical protein